MSIFTGMVNLLACLPKLKYSLVTMHLLELANVFLPGGRKSVARKNPHGIGVCADMLAA